MLEKCNKSKAETQEEASAAIWDAERKIHALLGEIQIHHDSKPEEESPGFDLNLYRDLIKAGRYSHEEPVIQNTEHWICSYKSIMIQLDIMEDYLQIIKDALEVLEGPITDIGWTPDAEKAAATA